MWRLAGQIGGRRVVGAGACAGIWAVVLVYSVNLSGAAVVWVRDSGKQKKEPIIGSHSGRFCGHDSQPDSIRA